MKGKLCWTRSLWQWPDRSYKALTPYGEGVGWGVVRRWIKMGHKERSKTRNFQSEQGG